jgi:YVTN family beta-propeller protein
MARDGAALFVANIGLFNYALVGPPEPGQGNPRGLSKPPFGFPSREAEVGKRMEGRNVPGLGSPYVPDGQSVWKYDVSEPNRPRRTATAKAGIMIHAPADAGKSVGGSAPNELLARGNRLYVSNANNDTVQVFDAATLKSVATIRLSPSPLVRKLRGVIPSGMAMSKDGRRLYVCESGLNAVGVIETATGKVIGHIPSGWFPTHVALSPDGRTLYVATQKGLGRGPRGSMHLRKPGDERRGLPDMPGMIQAVAVPTDRELPALSRTTLINNGIVDRSASGSAARAGSPRAARNGGARDRKGASVAGAHGTPSAQIEYVVFITKENHTFDGIFGGLPGAKGYADYAEFGDTGWIREKGRTERVPIMPNHIKLAREFAISDCFYMEPQASGDGHRWLVGVYPSLWTTRVFYSGWNYAPRNDAPGRLVPFGADGSQIPEDYLENGSLWEHLARGGITFRNYGEGYELPQTDEGPMANRSGTYYQANYPMPKVLYDNSCFDFPAYNTHIPDIARADWFKEDLEKYRKAHGGRIPRFLNIAICNDHGAGARPQEGYPYVCSYMADNDLALGRIVEYLTRQPEWKRMAIFVTQDDPGGDSDHVDRHRSFVLCISPYAKRGYVSHDHTSIMSIIKTIYMIFGLGPNNMFDALATDLADMMTAKPDFTPYTHMGSDRRVFREEETFDPSDPDFKKRRRRPAEVRLDDPKFVEWLANRGGGAR